MTRTIRSLNGGRARVWWVHRRQDALRALQLVVIVSAWLVVSEMDYRDRLDQERAAREAIANELAGHRAAKEGFARRLPRTTFVIEAATPEELRMRLAEIAGDLDGARAGLGRQP